MSPASASPAVAPTLRETADRLARAGIATARQDAELLLARALGGSRLGLLVEPAHPVGPTAREALAGLVARRVAQEPLQYLLGEAEFGGLRLAVGPGVFVPRPETEGLLARALQVTPPGPGRAVDLCTGSGALAVGLAAQRPALAVYAVEREPAALRWARRNVEHLALADRVTVLAGDLFEPLAGAGVCEPVDLVVANPPYLPTWTLGALPPEVREWEPWTALDGGADGLAVVDRILAGAPAVLRPGGYLLMEIGHDQAPAVRRRLAGAPWVAALRTHRDLAGHERVVEIVRR